MGWSALPYTIVCGQLGYNLAVIGRVAEGKELIERGYASELEKVSNLTTKMAYCSWQGLFISLIGEDHFNAAIKIDQLVEIAERSDSPFMILAFNTAKSNVMLGIENYTQVQSSCHKALKAIEGKSIRTGHVANVYYNLVLADLKLGDLDMAISHHEVGRSLVELAPCWWEPRYNFLQGLIHMHKTPPDYLKIEECFEKSIKGDEEVGALVPAAQTRFYLSKFLARKGEAERSLNLFTDLHSKFQGWDISVWQQRCKQELEPYRF